MTFSFLSFIFYFMYMRVLPARICVECVCSAHRGQEKALGPLKLKLQIFVSYHVEAGN